MKTKKAKKAATKNSLSTAIDTTKKVAKKANDVALKTTEEVISESLTIIGQWQGVATKALQEGLKLADKQQDLFFSTLETFKSQFTKGKKRAKKLFA